MIHGLIYLLTLIVFGVVSYSGQVPGEFILTNPLPLLGFWYLLQTIHRIERIGLKKISFLTYLLAVALNTLAFFLVAMSLSPQRANIQLFSLYFYYLVIIHLLALFLTFLLNDANRSLALTYIITIIDVLLGMTIVLKYGGIGIAYAFNPEVKVPYPVALRTEFIVLLVFFLIAVLSYFPYKQRDFL